MESYRAPSKVINQRRKRVSNIVIRRDEETKEGVAHMPGMAFTDFTRSGVPSAFALARMLDIGWRLAIPSIEKWNVQGKQIVVLGQNISVSPLFHQRARIRFPMMMRSRLIQVGNSSLSTETLVTDGEYGDVLVRARRSFSLMNKTTGRPERLPEHVRLNLYSLLPKRKNQTIRVLPDFPAKPEGIPRHPVVVRHSDTDALYHTNQASYFTYCMEGATEGAKLGHFRLLKGDLLSYPIESLECRYKGESHPGDELEVFVWEDESNSAKLCAQIERKGKVIWMGRLCFRVGIDSKL